MSNTSRTLSPHESASLVEHSILPLLTLKTKSGEGQVQAYVNAFIVGEKKMLVHGQLVTPLYYLSLVAMKGQGTTLQAIFARLVNPHGKGVFLDGVGEVALAHHQPRLMQCGYSLHWNFEQAEVQPTQDLHAVIESRMLTVCDPVRGMVSKQREARTSVPVPQGKQGKRHKERVSLSTAKQSQTQNSLSEIRHREQRPLFLLLVPGQEQGHTHVLWQQHLAFLDLRVPWPLDPSWAGFLWERGLSGGEIERLKAWAYTPPSPVADSEQRTGVHQEEAVVPLFAEAYLCLPQPAQIQQDLQEALQAGRISAHLRSHLVALPPASSQDDALQVTTARIS